MGWFDPAWKTEDRRKLEKALAAVAKTKNTQDLLKIAVTAPLEAVQIAAVERLEDEQLLKEIARADNTKKDAAVPIRVQRGTREKAVDRIRDQELLYEIVVTDFGNSADGQRIALYALTHLKDQALLRKAALSKSGSWQFNAAGRVKDEKVLAEIVENAPTADTANIASARIGNFDLLLDLLDRPGVKYPGYLYDQMNYLLNPAEFFTVDPHEHDAVHIPVKNFGRMLFHREKAKAPVTAEHRARYIEAAVREKRRLDLAPFSNSELERIFWGSPSRENRERALDKLLADPDYSPQQIRDALKVSHFPDGWKHSNQPYILRKIGERLRETDDPEVLLRWIKDPETDPCFAARCLRALYEKDWAGKIKWSYNRGISTLQDEAVRALLGNMPEDDRWTRSYCLTMILKLIPKEMAEVYGITCGRFESSDEDAFGRYEYEETMIRYRGRTVPFYNAMD